MSLRCFPTHASFSSSATCCSCSCCCCPTLPLGARRSRTPPPLQNNVSSILSSPFSPPRRQVSHITPLFSPLLPPAARNTLSPVTHSLNPGRIITEKHTQASIPLSLSPPFPLNLLTLYFSAAGLAGEEGALPFPPSLLTFRPEKASAASSAAPASPSFSGSSSTVRVHEREGDID